jgi:tetratricopeptide (TPR) repeat protein
MKRTILILATVLAAAPYAEAQRMPVTTTSDAARVHFEQGRTRLSHADFVGALSHFDAALAADADFGLAHLYRALSTAQDREQHAQAASAARVSDGERQLIEAYAAHLEGDHERELELMDAAADRYPDDPNTPFWMGFEYYNLERYEDAMAAFDRAHEADPDYAGAYNLAGYTAMELNDDAAAERAFREYVRLAPDEANPYDSFGEFHMIRGRYDEAEAMFQQALARDSEFTVSRNNLVRVAILRMVDAYEAAAQAGDAAAITAMHHATAVILPGNEPAVAGMEALTAYFAEEYAEASPVELESRNIIVATSGDMAYDIGASSWPGGTGKYLTVYRRFGDRWMIVADTWNSDAPAAAVTAGSE